MRYRVQRTARTWVLIGIALVVSFVIAYVEHRSREARAPTRAPATESYQVEVELR